MRGSAALLREQILLSHYRTGLSVKFVNHPRNGWRLQGWQISDGGISLCKLIASQVKHFIPSPLMQLLEENNANSICIPIGALLLAVNRSHAHTSIHSPLTLFPAFAPLKVYLVRLANDITTWCFVVAHSTAVTVFCFYLLQ
jgi:hypothetical protein